MLFGLYTNGVSPMAIIQLNMGVNGAWLDLNTNKQQQTTGQSIIAPGSLIAR
jgi:hypothetical protein